MEGIARSYELRVQAEKAKREEFRRKRGRVHYRDAWRELYGDRFASRRPLKERYMKPNIKHANEDSKLEKPNDEHEDLLEKKLEKPNNEHEDLVEKKLEKPNDNNKEGKDRSDGSQEKNN